MKEQKPPLGNGRRSACAGAVTLLALLLHSRSDLRSTWQAGSDREGVFLCRLSSRCGSFNPELHCCYELGIHKTPRHHNTGDRDGSFDPSDDTCLPSYLRPLTRLSYGVYRGMWNTNEARNAIAKPIRNPAHIHLCFTNLMMPQARC